MWVTYSIFNNKGASKITVSYLLVTNQKGGNFSTWRSWNMLSLLYKSNGWETIQNRRKLFIRFRLQQTISLCTHLGKLMSSRTSMPVHWRRVGAASFQHGSVGSCNRVFIWAWGRLPLLLNRELCYKGQREPTAYSQARKAISDILLSHKPLARQGLKTRTWLTRFQTELRTAA